jgi:hypothetical protein
MAGIEGVPFTPPEKGGAVPAAVPSAPVPAIPEVPAPVVTGVTPAVAGVVMEREAALRKQTYVILFIALLALLLLVFILNKR